MSEFDDKAATWDLNPERKERAKMFAEIMRNNIDLFRMNEAMEYGCGTGLLSFALRDDLRDVTLMDESEEMIKVVDEKCEDLDIRHFHPMQYNLMEDGAQHHNFDLIYTMMALHHIPDTRKILNIFKGILTPKGYLVLIDLEKEDGTFHDHEFDGHHGFEEADLEDALEQSGFRVMHYEIGDTIVKDVNGVRKEYPVFIMIARKED
jgi:2-polyprenyl-3-methyl-5-hydroxy-6-metoxy-1,4-benzoquinol methylase